MSAPRILVVQPDSADPVGPLGEWLTQAGAELDIRRMPDDVLPDDLSGHDALLCLGGGMNAEDDITHPWLATIRALLGKAVTEDKPTLGVCLGSQLLAVAAGGRVSKGHDGPEVGPALVAKKDAAWVDPLFADLPLMQDVLQFHVDAIEQLPPQAELLASSPRYSHQAYRLNRCVYGIQFHIETTPDIVRTWAARSPDKIAAAREDVFDDDTLTRLHDDMMETWKPFAQRFVELAAGNLTPATVQRRTLPLA